MSASAMIFQPTFTHFDMKQEFKFPTPKDIKTTKASNAGGHFDLTDTTENTQ